MYNICEVQWYSVINFHYKYVKLLLFLFLSCPTCTWSCQVIKMQEEVTTQRMITVPLKRVEEFKYLRTTLTDQNSIQ